MEERVRAVKAEIEAKGEDAPISAWDVEKPLRTDRSEFGIWLRMQVHRKDRVGALARVAMDDPFWPGGGDRAKLREHFRNLGARSWVLESLNIAIREFDQVLDRRKARAKNKAAKVARRKNRKQH